MAYEVVMPQLGLTMEEGTVSAWIKHEGDAVKVGDVIRIAFGTKTLAVEVLAVAEAVRKDDAATMYKEV